MEQQRLEAGAGMYNMVGGNLIGRRLTSGDRGCMRIGGHGASEHGWTSWLDSLAGGCMEGG
jgi:hypothetical protein